MRHCMRCERTLFFCNSYCLARDTLAADRGEIFWSQVRELCGLCSEELQVKGEFCGYLVAIE